MGIKKVITRSTLCRLKTTVRRTPTPSSRSRASSHRILSSLTHSGSFAASPDKIYGHVGIGCVESTSKNGFSDGWYALNPSHGQEGGETADSAFTSRVQGVSCFPGDEGRVGHIYRGLAVGGTTVRRAGNGRFVSLTTQTVPDQGGLLKSQPQPGRHRSSAARDGSQALRRESSAGAVHLRIADTRGLRSMCGWKHRSAERLA
jgi:hypothetical protein